MNMIPMLPLDNVNTVKGNDQLTCDNVRSLEYTYPYPEPVYTGRSSVHWNATGWPSVHWDTIGWPNQYLQGTLEHYWSATGETQTIAALIGVPLGGL